MLNKKKIIILSVILFAMVITQTVTNKIYENKIINENKEISILETKIENLKGYVDEDLVYLDLESALSSLPEDFSASDKTSLYLLMDTYLEESLINSTSSSVFITNENVRVNMLDNLNLKLGKSPTTEDETFYKYTKVKPIEITINFDMNSISNIEQFIIKLNSSNKIFIVSEVDFIVPSDYYTSVTIKILTFYTDYINELK